MDHAAAEAPESFQFCIFMIKNTVGDSFLGSNLLTMVIHLNINAQNHVVMESGSHHRLDIQI